MNNNLEKATMAARANADQSWAGLRPYMRDILELAQRVEEQIKKEGTNQEVLDYHLIRSCVSLVGVELFLRSQDEV